MEIPGAVQGSFASAVKPKGENLHTKGFRRDPSRHVAYGVRKHKYQAERLSRGQKCGPASEDSLIYEMIVVSATCTVYYTSGSGFIRLQDALFES
jgi:hypothetical protein